MTSSLCSQQFYKQIILNIFLTVEFWHFEVKFNCNLFPNLKRIIVKKLDSRLKFQETPPMTLRLSHVFSEIKVKIRVHLCHVMPISLQFWGIQIKQIWILPLNFVQWINRQNKKILTTSKVSFGKLVSVEQTNQINWKDISTQKLTKFWKICKITKNLNLTNCLSFQLLAGKELANPPWLLYFLEIHRCFWYVNDYFF